MVRVKSQSTVGATITSDRDRKEDRTDAGEEAAGCAAATCATFVYSMSAHVIPGNIPVHEPYLLFYVINYLRDS